MTQKILNLGFLLLLASIITRGILTYTNNTHYFEAIIFYEKELIFYAISFIWFLISFYNYFLRERCNKCRSVRFRRASVKKIKDYIGTKKVQEKIAKGEWATRHVSVTYEVFKVTNACLDCNNQWTKTIKQEAG